MQTNSTQSSRLKGNAIDRLTNAVQLVKADQTGCSEPAIKPVKKAELDEW